MITIYILATIIGIALIAIGAYLFYIFILPRRVEEVAKMIEMGQIKQAIKKLHELLEKDERNPDIHYLLAEAYAKDGNTQHAIVEYRQVIKMDRFADRRKEIEVRGKLARLYRDQGALDDAKKEYLLLTKIDGGNFDHYYNLGMLFFNASYFEKALQYFRKAVKLNPKHANSQYYLGQIYFRHNQNSEAKDAFTKAVNIDPKNYKAHYFIGLILRNIQDFDWAIKEFDIAQKDPDIQPRALLGKGLCYIDKQLFKQAISEFEKGLRFVSKNTEAAHNLHYYLAHCAEQSRDLQTAISNWETIMNGNPNFKDVKEKLKSYEEFRMDDDLKDFLIASPAEFENTATKIIEAMGYTVIEMDLISDTAVDILASEQEAKFRNMRKSNRVIKLRRSTDTVAESSIKQLHEDMKKKNSNLGIFITAGNFSTAALNYAQSRPIDMVDRSGLSKVFNKMRSSS